MFDRNLGLIVDLGLSRPGLQLKWFSDIYRVKFSVTDVLPSISGRWDLRLGSEFAAIAYY